MELIHKKQFPLSHLHTDCWGRVKPSVLMFFAQEVAESHCYELHADWDTLQEKGLFWAVIRQKFQFSRLPAAGEVLTLETWPMPTTRVAYPRSTVAYDADGNVVFQAISLWVLMSSKTRAMIPPGKSGVDIEGVLRGTELEAPGTLAPKQLENKTVRTVRYCHLDRNGHMNNTKYLDWLDDLLPAAFHQDHPLREVTVCYLSDALENEQIALNWELSETGDLAVEALREGTDVPIRHHRVFSVRAVY